MASTIRTLAVLGVSFITGCTEVPVEDPGGQCVDGKCDGFGGAELLTPLSETTTNPDAYPRGFAQLGDKALFFSAARKGLWITDGTPAGTKLLRDLEPTLDSYQDTPAIVVMGDTAYWTMRGAIWASDGTPAGTKLVIDFGPAQNNFVTDPVVLDGELLFGAMDKLYISDGTPAGTEVLADVSAGRIVVMDGKAYFSCSTPATGNELCVTDKTAAGTKVVKEIRAGIQGGAPRFLGVAGSRLLFSAQVDGTPLLVRSVWSSDGTEAGTIMLMSHQANGDTVSQYETGVVFGGSLYFACYTSATGSELCKSDGTVAGTSVLDIVPGSGALNSSAPMSMQPFGDRLYFTAKSPGAGRELWSTDGTVAGTSMLVDLTPTHPTFDGIGFTELVVLGDALLFAAHGDGYTEQLWRTDGTAAGTTKLADILSDGVQQRYALNFTEASYIVLGDKLLFAADDGEHGLEPWVTDGTAQGTKLLSDVVGPVSKVQLLGSTTFGNASYFSIDDNTAPIVWRTNGTAAGTGKFHELPAAGVGGYPGFAGFTAVGSQLYYGSYKALWRTDGTTPTKVRDLPGSMYDVAALGNRFAFTGSTANQSYGLWVSDGTASGTVETGAINAERLAMASGKLWLTALSGGAGNELWTSDGTVAGTKAVADIHPSGHSKPSGFVGLGGNTLFAATDAAAGSELWITDGTAPGTRRLTNIAPGSAGSGPRYMFAWNDMVLFFASPSSGVVELWKTDGTEAGTTRVKAIAGTSQFVAWNDHVLFAAQDASGTELWRTDGTEAGTVRVADIYKGVLSSNPSHLVLAGAGGPLYFVAEEPVGGRELWKLASPTGTPARAADVMPGPRSSNPSQLQARGSALLFVAEGGTGPTLFRLGAAPDVIAPVIECPDDITIAAPDAGGVEVTFTPTAIDNDGDAAITTSPASGDVFAVGTTTVTATATDEASNTASCTFEVTVTYNEGGGGGGGGGGSGGGSGGSGGGGGGGGGEEPSGGCSATSPASSLPVGLVLLAVPFARRRRRV